MRRKKDSNTASFFRLCALRFIFGKINKKGLRGYSSSHNKHEYTFIYKTHSRMFSIIIHEQFNKNHIRSITTFKWHNFRQAYKLLE